MSFLDKIDIEKIERKKRENKCLRLTKDIFDNLEQFEKYLFSRFGVYELENLFDKELNSLIIWLINQREIKKEVV